MASTQRRSKKRRIFTQESDIVLVTGLSNLQIPILLHTELLYEIEMPPTRHRPTTADPVRPKYAHPNSSRVA
jgi:hypothetical protein